MNGQQLAYLIVVGGLALLGLIIVGRGNTRQLVADVARRLP